MDISKLRKKIREAREENRRQKRVPAAEGSADVVKDVPSAGPPGTQGPPASSLPHGPLAEPAPVDEGRSAAPEASPVSELLTEGSASLPATPPAEMEQAQESDEEEDIDDYLDRDEIQDRRRLGNQIKLLAFRLGDEEYAVNMMDLKEVQLYHEVTRVPRTPTYLLGIMSLRGKVIPVLDLRQRLGIRGEVPEAPRILVFSTGDEPVGAQVDSITGVLTTWTEEVMPSLNTLSEDESRFISGVIRTEHRFVSLLNLDELLMIEMEI